VDDEIMEVYEEFAHFPMSIRLGPMGRTENGLGKQK